jgi:hypothetical protein
MKKGDVVVVADGDYDEGRTIASQNRGTEKLCTEEFFLSTHSVFIALPSHQKYVGKGQDIDGQRDTYTVDSPG